MFPFLVDRSWFENFWYGERPRAKRRPFTRRLAPERRDERARYACP